MTIAFTGHTNRTATSPRDAISIRVPDRRHTPSEVTVHLGATNSGKTHGSIAELVAAGAGIYVAPLRMLAHEVFDRLVAECGEHPVGLLTGDQVIRPDAPILCCTAEMAPLDAPLAVIDEAHWVDDPSRGKAWTRLLIEGRYRKLSIIAAPETEAFLRHLYPHLKIVRHHRLGELWEGGTTTIAGLWSGTVVVAFSRRAVLALAREIRIQAGLRTGVLYGSLPAGLRADQILRFESGELDVLVATDSIGHGVNLPASTIVFAETEKYDGTSRRPLHLWEAAQIAGRAGRGADQPGLVQTLTGVPGLRSDLGLVHEAVNVAGGSLPSDLVIDRAPVAPAFDELGTDDPAKLLAHLLAWQEAAAEELADHPWAVPASTRGVERRLRSSKKVWGNRWPLAAQATWAFASTPVADDEAFTLAARSLIDPTLDVARELGVDQLDDADLATAEQIAASVRDLTVIVRRIGPVGGLDIERLAEAGARAEARAAVVLEDEILTNDHGRCTGCGTPVAFRFPRCQRCAFGTPRTSRRPKRRARRT